MPLLGKVLAQAVPAGRANHELIVDMARHVPWQAQLGWNPGRGREHATVSLGVRSPCGGPASKLRQLDPQDGSLQGIQAKLPPTTWCTYLGRLPCVRSRTTLSAIWASSHRTAPPSPNAPRFFEGKKDKQLMIPPSLQAPMDWAASSTTGRPTLGSVAGRPNRWTGIKARVLARKLRLRPRDPG